MANASAPTKDYEITGGAPIHVISYDSESHEEADPDTLHEALEYVGKRRITWINVDRVDDPAVLTSLEKDYGIHPLTVEDVKNTHQRPKVETYPGYLYIVTQMIRRDTDGELITEQVSMLLSDKFVITLQDRPGDVFEDVRTRIRNGRPRIRGNGPDYLTYALIDAIVDAYFPIIESLGTLSEELEDKILEEPKINVRAEIQHMRRQLLTLRRVAWPQRDAATQLERGESQYISNETRTYLRDVTDHATRVLDFVETNRELSASLMDLHMASVAERTNDVMKVLTITATIFIPLTFIAGVYGMNFENMPELHTQNGYFIALGIMAALGIIMFAAFRKRGWI